MLSSGFSSLSSAILSSMGSADKLMEGASASIASGDLDSLVDASSMMSQAKLNVGIAAKMVRVQDEMMSSTLSILA